MKIAFRHVVGHVPFDFNQIHEISVGSLNAAGLTWARRSLARWAMMPRRPSRPAMLRRVAPDGRRIGWAVAVVARTWPSDHLGATGRSRTTDRRIDGDPRELLFGATPEARLQVRRGGAFLTPSHLAGCDPESRGSGGVRRPLLDVCPLV